MFGENNHPRQKELRRRLRREMTMAERTLWSQIRGRQLDGLRFRRQYGIGPYVVDFYCPALRLAIEVDGETHTEAFAKRHDCVRTAYLAQRDIVVLRFWNEEILDRCEQVLQRISEFAATLPNWRDPFGTDCTPF